MHIRHVAIENIRRFGSGSAGVDLSLPTSGWIVVAGRNGSGKTTFLKVLALALSPVFSHDYADTIFSWPRQGAKTARSRVTLVPSPEERFADGADLVVGDDWEPRHGAMSHGRGECDTERAFAGPWSSDPKGWFAAGYGAYRRPLGQSQLVERWSPATTREGAFLTLFRDDAALLHPIRWLMDLHHRSLDPDAPATEKKQARSIVRNVVSLLNDGLLGDTEVLGVDSYGLSVLQDGQKLSVLHLGAGAQVTTAVVVDLVRLMYARFGTVSFGKAQSRPVVQHDGVVLIDEVDAHLHVSWQQKIGPWLKEHFPRIQFIVTTHSPFICQSAEEDGLILLPAPGSSESPRIADRDLHRRVVNGSVDDALLSDLFGLEHTWSAGADEKRARLAAVEVKVLAGSATPAQQEEYRHLLSEIPQTMSEEVERTAARLASTRSRGRRR